MDMQDKEFDELFRSKLDGFEAEPSAKVWSDIAGILNAPKKRKILFPFLSVAASIIILIAAGLLFIPKKLPIKTRQNSVAKIILPLTKTTDTVILQTAKVTSDIQPIISHISHPVSQHRSRLNSKFIVTNIYTLPAHSLLNKRENQQLILSVSQTQNFNDKSIAPVVINAVIEQRPADNDVEIAALGSSEKETSAVKVKSGIHNLGGLVNALIAKVDKRKDKVIEFSDNDDGESKLTGINLGIIKIKKER